MSTVIDKKMFDDIEKSDNPNLICAPSDAIPVFKYAVDICKKTKEFNFISGRHTDYKTFDLTQRLPSYSKIANATNCGYKNIEKEHNIKAQKQSIMSGFSIIIETKYNPDKIINIIISLNNNRKVFEKYYRNWQEYNIHWKSFSEVISNMTASVEQSKEYN